MSHNTCDRLPYLYAFKSLSELIEASLEDEKMIMKFQELAETNIDWITECISEEFFKLKFSIIQDIEGVVEDINISTIDYTDDHIVSYEGNEIYLIIKGYINFTCHVAYSSYSSAIWENVEEYPYDYIDTKLTVSKPFDTGVTLKTDEKHSEVEEIEINDFQPSSIEIDAEKYF